MKNGSRIWLIALALAVGWGCAQRPEMTQEERQFEEGWFPSPEIRASLPDHIDGFHRELRRQYIYLDVHYLEFDRLQGREPGAENHKDARCSFCRVHRKLYQRHLYLARLHEDRIWFGLEAQFGDDRHLARLHRHGAMWHRKRSYRSASKVAPEDRELKEVRRELNSARPAPTLDRRESAADSTGRNSWTK